MATVGQSLKTPETGWTRYDDNNVNFGYVGTGWKIASVSPSYGYINNQYHFTTGVINDSISFNFVGTKIRIIGEMQAGCSGNISISIDGVSETFSAVNSSKVYVALLYEKNNLDNKEHRVVITNNTTSTLIFDAIDIDESGELEPYSPISTINNPTNLTADSSDAQVTLNWDTVNGATDYNVKRSITAGGPYETIATTISSTSYMDANVVNSTTYYYVVTAINASGESANSNEASATPIISAPLNLTAMADNFQMALSWTAVANASGYNVKRSTTAGGPYTIIASNVATNNYMDTTVTNGTTYYYVVTALGGTSESANSNEASVTPVASINALLRITMNDSSERQYKVSQMIANNFISWYDRAVGTGNTCYSFDDSIDGSKEYLAFEKIISFKVIPLPAE